MQAPIITLVTDWGTSDFFCGMFKGHLLSALPEARVVDICHEVRACDPLAAVPFVRHACTAFPEGSIHLIDVASTSECQYIVARHEGRYFVCADNGLLYNAFGCRCECAARLKAEAVQLGTFIADTLMLPAVVRLAKGERPEQIGTKVEEKGGTMPLYYNEHGNQLSVTITHYDAYGNACLGITRQEFERICAGRRFATKIPNVPPMTQIMQSYIPAPGSGKIILVESSTGYLQIAMCHRRAEQLLNLDFNRSVLFEFER